MATLYAAMEESLAVVRDGAVTERSVGGDPECLAVDPRRPDRVLVGTFGDGLRRSTDGGRTVEPVGGGTLGPDAAVTALAVAPGDPDVVWAGTEPSAVYRSTDGGATWTALPDPTTLESADRWSFPPRPHTHHVRWIEPDPADAERWYVAIEAGAFLRTSDGGSTWVDHPEGARRDNHTLRTHPAAPGRVYAAAGDGYAESADGGETWSYPQSGLDHRYVWGLAVDPGDPETVLVSAARGARSAHTAASADAHVYRRDAGTDGWERVGGPDTDGAGDAGTGEDATGGIETGGIETGEGVVRAVFATTDAPGTFYGVTNRWVARSTDGGRSWTALAPGWADRFGDETPRGLAVVE